MNKILFIAASSARSRAYAQALSAYDLAPGHTLIYGATGSRGLGTVPDKIPPKSRLDVFVPDLSIVIEETCIESGWSYSFIEAGHINDQKIFDFISKSDFELIIYSGFGSQIVGKKLLETGVPFLHMHAGKLPEYRGSTTIYYSILDGQLCSVTAILLERQIDKGPIVATKAYPIPRHKVDLDYLYDNAIRADLLVEVMAYYAKHNQLPKLSKQDVSATTGSYYIIHPVLKHVAYLSLSKQDDQQQEKLG